MTPKDIEAVDPFPTMVDDVEPPNVMCAHHAKQLNWLHRAHHRTYTLLMQISTVLGGEGIDGTGIVDVLRESEAIQKKMVADYYGNGRPGTKKMSEVSIENWERKQKFDKMVLAILSGIVVSVSAGMIFATFKLVSTITLLADKL